MFVYVILTMSRIRTCEGPPDTCHSSEPVNLTLECVSTGPRVFIIENFLSDAEADAIINIANPRVLVHTHLHPR